jgi:hypothetical protein
MTYIGKGNLGGGPLLQQEFTGRFVKQKDGKGTMQNGPWLLRGEFMRRPLGGRSNDIVVVVQHQDSVLLHHVLLGHGIAVPCFGGGSRGHGGEMSCVVQVLSVCMYSSKRERCLCGCRRLVRFFGNAFGKQKHNTRVHSLAVITNAGLVRAACTIVVVQ